MAIQHSEMSQAEIEEFLRVPRFAIVGTNRVNGPPQLSPVWYLYEDSRIYFTMYIESAKYRNLRRDPRIGICIAGESPDARAVMFYGSVELITDDSTWVDEVCWRIVRRYYDSDKEAQSFIDLAAAGGKGSLAIVTPDKVLAQDYN
ncbi:MAG: TIGR03618 family F420-dependent PPOX class oxidoreductase [Gammaproteobacteria bacterium]|nr:TIGR03618 family F420-dependent PPOX class oxidoreductase [Gammaproteobacteria bacterium]